MLTESEQSCLLQPDGKGNRRGCSTRSVQGPKDGSIPILLRNLSYFSASPVTRRTPNYENDLFPERVRGRSLDGQRTHYNDGTEKGGYVLIDPRSVIDGSTRTISKKLYL